MARCARMADAWHENSPRQTDTRHAAMRVAVSPKFWGRDSRVGDQGIKTNEERGGDVFISPSELFWRN